MALQKGPGRPTKYSDLKADAICDSLRRGNTRTAAANAAGIHVNTLRRWLEENEDFQAAVEEAEALAEEDRVVCITDAAPSSWQAAAWWLERRPSSPWRKPQQIDVNLSNRTDDELAAALAAALVVPDEGAEGDRGGVGEEDLGEARRAF